MPLFDVGTERAPLVALARPEEQAFDADARAVVREHLPALVGTKAFTVVAPDAGRATVDAPGRGQDGASGLSSGAVLALDAAGSSVLVVVVATLGQTELAAALGDAGRAARLTRSQLADLYPAGPERFRKDVTDFYDALPVGRWPQPAPGAARLVVLCAEVTPDVQDALGFLRSAGAPVDVLVLGAVPAEPGRRLVDVSPLVSAPVAGGATAIPVGRVSAPLPVGRVSAPARSAVAARPGQLTGPVRTSAFSTSNVPLVQAVPSAAEMTTVLPPVRATDYPVYSEPPRELPEPFEAPDTHVPVPRGTGRSPLSAPLPVVDLPAPGSPYTPIFLSVPDHLSALPERPSDAPVLDPGPRASLDLAVAPEDSTGYVAGPGEAAAWEGSQTSPAGRSAYRASAFIAAKKYMPEKLEQAQRRAPAPAVERVPEAVPAGRGAARVHEAPGASYERPAARSFDDPASLPFDESGSPFWADLSAQFAEPVRFDPPDPPDARDVVGPQAALERTGPTDAALGALAAELHSALPLVWVRHRRGERFEALLHPDGTLETSDGFRYGDPSRAASAVSGTATADGWRVWRAGESGPTLAELRG